MVDAKKPQGVLARLREDTRGNVIMITAAAVIPLMGLAGAAFDMGRVYLVKSRLQHACDASVLAYRRTMVGTNVTQQTEPTARNFFNANFAQNLYGSGAPAIDFSVDSQVVVHGVASVTVPMAIMTVFGYNQQTLRATCDAQLQLPNTDVMFVLDTTGSMTDTNPGDSTSRIVALRQAVIDFYNILEGAKVAGTQVRYGFVPYSNTVNVGALLKRDWMVDNAVYQSRVFNRQTYTAGSAASAYQTTYTAWSPADNFTTTYQSGDPENCTAPTNTQSTASSNSSWTPNSTSIPRSRTNYRTVTGIAYSAATQSNGTCRITVKTWAGEQQTRTETYEVNPNSGTVTYSNNYYWDYQPVTFNVSTLKGSAASGLMAGGNLATNLANPAAMTSTTQTPATVGGARSIAWSGTGMCIEERKTLRPLEFGTAYDMDVDSVPDTTNPDTQWRPFIPGLVYARNVTQTYSAASAAAWSWSFANTYNTTAGYPNLSSYTNDRAACPSPSRKLMSKEGGLTASVLSTYLNNLKTVGDTYHDIGFLWGLRLASAQGLFSSENATAPNGFDISRNIIFMTDGQTESHIQDYDAYGLSALDRRRTSSLLLPDDGAQDSIVEDRLTRYCNIAKGKGMTVWVIAFGTTLTPLLQGCATEGRAYQADNSSQLAQTFADIAARIAQLRLTK